uniref:Uncharacterized protein n=1 Tax=Anopheles maculatus TaxID=74869 RepID=A0A182T310_9DIPT
MYASELLILVLAVQQVTTACQRNIADCVKSRSKYRLQREWRSGTFRFDSDQFEPTRWEWQRQAKIRTDTKRPRLSVTRKKPEAEAKLLWKVENRHEDYDSLMSSEDDGMGMWPEQSLTSAPVYGRAAASHDNIGNRMVKMVPSTFLGMSTVPSASQFPENALFSEENFSYDNTKDTDESRVHLQLYDDVDHMCATCADPQK